MKKMSKVLSIVFILYFSVNTYAVSNKNKVFIQLKSDMWKMGVDFEYGPYGQDEYIFTNNEEPAQSDEVVREELRAALNL